MGDLSVADPIAVVVGGLKASATITTEFGGPDHVSGLLEAPWPHIRVVPGAGGDLGDLTWRSTPEVTLEVLGHPDGRTGQAALRRLAMIAAGVVKQLQDAPYTEGAPVVSYVEPSGTLAFAPLATGQQRWIVGLLITLHPPVG